MSATNIRQLSAGAANYLAENNHRYWKFRIDEKAGTTFWFGFEQREHAQAARGSEYSTRRSAAGRYVPAALMPDPSFRLGARAFKPKYAWGYIGVGYNSLLGGGMSAKSHAGELFCTQKPSEVVVSRRRARR